MKVVVRGVHVTLTEGLKNHVQEQLADPLERLFPQEAVELEVHLVDNSGSKGGPDKECRVTFHIPGASAIHLSEASEDFFKSVSVASDRLDHAAKRFLERRHQHHLGAETREVS